MFVYDLPSGRMKCQLSHGETERSCEFSPDGKLIVTRDRALPDRSSSRLRLWEAATGKLLGEFKGHKDSITDATFSPDGRLLASVGFVDQTVRLWDATNRRQLRKLSTGASRRWWLSFSPDGRLLAGAGVGEPVQLWEVVTGGELHTLNNKLVSGKHERVASALGFSPDGRSLFTADSSGNLFCWDVTSGQLRREWRAHLSCVTTLVLSADGRVLASRCATDVLTWDVADLCAQRAAGAALRDADLKSLWDDLAGADTTKAWRAVWKLAASPRQAVPFLRERVRPDRTPPGAKPLAALIANLDSDSFREREKATRELEQLGAHAEAALRKALEGKRSPEFEKRARAILEKLVAQAPPLPPAQLRLLRAVAALELAGTTEAKRLLEELAGGAPEARLTHEAGESLRRLTRSARDAR